MTAVARLAARRHYPNSTDKNNVGQSRAFYIRELDALGTHIWSRQRSGTGGGHDGGLRSPPRVVPAPPQTVYLR